MSAILIEIPKELADAIRLPPDEQPSRMRQELAIRLYQKGPLSFGRARDLAQMTKWDFHNLLGREGIERRYDLDGLQQDLQTLENFN